MDAQGGHMATQGGWGGVNSVHGGDVDKGCREGT